MESRLRPLAAEHAAPTLDWPSEGLEEVAIPQLDLSSLKAFDASALVDLVRKAVLGSETVTESAESINSNGKRTVKSSVESNKRAKAIDSRKPIYLARTKVPFQLHASQLDQTLIASLLDSTSQVRLGEVGLRPSSHSSTGIISRTSVDVFALSGEFIAPLSLLEASCDELRANVRRPFSITSSSWLFAAARLQDEGRLSLVSQLSIYTYNPLGRGRGGKDFYVELDISVHLPPAAFASGRRFIQQTALDHLTLMRFINPGDTDRQQQRLSILDGRGVYANLLSPTMKGHPAMQPVDLLPTLMPFQLRSTEFLLAREGKKVSTDEQQVASLHSLESVATSTGEQVEGLWWEAVAGHQHLWFNGLTGAFASDRTVVMANNLQGGILAEEMGLGKTVEILATILLNRGSDDRKRLPSYFSAVSQVQVLPSAITLIVAPETLRRQWLDEAGVHAPSLSVYSYQGHVHAQRDTPPGITWPEWARDNFDIVIVSFETLRSEVHTARNAPERSRRRPRVYERPRSPLVQLEYWRVIMDEVQLVGQSSAAETASMCPRISSIAVSGTLVRSLDDLHACFSFLRAPELDHRKGSQWTRMLSPEFSPFLIDALRILASRHTKAQVREELRLPRQDHHLVPVDFTAVESSFYDQVWHDCLQKLHLDGTGAPTSDDYELDANVMRGQLLRLRQACTHPQVVTATVGRYADLGSGSNLRTIDEVLLYMIAGAKAEWNTSKHSLTLKSIDRVRLAMLNKEDDDRLIICRARLEGLQPVVMERIADYDTELLEARISGPGYRIDSARALEKKAAADDTSADGSDTEEIENLQKKARRSHLTSLRARQREWYEILHRVQQFEGMVYFQLGEELTKKRDELNAVLADTNGATAAHTVDEQKVVALKKLEDAAYADAEKTRQVLLKDTRATIDRGTRLLQRFDFKAMIHDLEPQQAWGGTGLQSADVFESLNEIKHLICDNGCLIKDWRDKILSRLFRTVNRDVDQENEADDQYQENLDAQAEAEALLEMYRPLLAERERIVTGRVPIGSTSRPQLFVELARAESWRKRQSLLAHVTSPDSDLLAEDEAVAEAQQQQLDHFRQLEKQMQNAKLPKGRPSLADHISELREIIDRTIRQEESDIGKSGLTRARQMFNEQNTVLENLKKEQLLMASLFNQRSVYFKAIQALSDQVRDIETSSNLQRDIDKAKQEEANLQTKTAHLESKMRYAQGLQDLERSDATTSEARTCLICTETISRGVLTKCGHVMCEDCFVKWTTRNPVCPFCKTRLGRDDYNRVLYEGSLYDPTLAGPNGEQAAGDEQPADDSLVTNRNYRILDRSTLNEVDRLPINRRIGSKLELLVKFLQYIERNTGAKSLVFSSFARALDLVGDALRFQGIKFVRLDGGGTKGGRAVDQFRTSPTHNVLLLHSEAQSSGLNLLCATNVFILEPLVNHALELQAISRVNRIGATQESNVYCLYVRQTVEERIVSLAATRHRSLYVRGNKSLMQLQDEDAAAMEADNRAEAAQSSQEGEVVKGDFVSSTEDVSGPKVLQYVVRIAQSSFRTRSSAS